MLVCAWYLLSALVLMAAACPMAVRPLPSATELNPGIG
jgi:hypothetical protein